MKTQIIGCALLFFVQVPTMAAQHCNPRYQKCTLSQSLSAYRECKSNAKSHYIIQTRYDASGKMVSTRKLVTSCPDIKMDARPSGNLTANKSGLSNTLQGFFSKKSANRVPAPSPSKVSANKAPINKIMQDFFAKRSANRAARPYVAKQAEKTIKPKMANTASRNTAQTAGASIVFRKKPKKELLNDRARMRFTTINNIASKHRSTSASLHDSLSNLTKR